MNSHSRRSHLHRVRNTDLDIRHTALTDPDGRHHDSAGVFVAGGRHTSVAARIACVEALGERRDPRSIPTLKKAAEDLSASVRAAAMKALGRFPHSSVRHVLHQGMYDEEASVRQIAVETAARRGAPDSIPYLLRLANDRNWDVRRSALHALAAWNDPAAPMARIERPPRRQGPKALRCSKPKNGNGLVAARGSR